MKLRRILKFIIATIVFYAFLAFNVFHIGEFLVPTSKDYLESNEIYQDKEQEYFETGSDTTNETSHFAWDIATNLMNLCESIAICDKIDFKGNFTDTEKYIYTRIISTLIQFIDENSTEEKQMEEVINRIEINKGNGNRRGYATRDTIIFNLWSVQSKKEFVQLSTHEMGHITDLGYIQWLSSRKNKSFTEFGKVVFAIDDSSLSFYKLSRDKETIRKAEAKKKDFCSGYGMSDPFEDLAECFNLYINHNSLFRKIAKTNAILKKKYNFIANIFDGQYISSSSQDLSLVKTNISRRPRDTTKITN